MEKIAPTYVSSVYKKGSQPFAKARQMLITLGEMLDREDRAREILADIDTTLANQRRRLEAHGAHERPVALVSFLDDRHVRIFAPNGLYQTTLDGLGLDNVWPHDGNYWGFSTVGLEAIAPYPNGRVVVIEPISPGLSDNLAQSPFWTYLPAVQRSQVYQIEPVWPFGAVFPVKRLAIQLTDALIQEVAIMYAEAQVVSTAPRLPGKLPLTAMLLVLGALAASAAPGSWSLIRWQSYPRSGPTTPLITPRCWPTSAGRPGFPLPCSLAAALAWPVP